MFEIQFCIKRVYLRVIFHVNTMLLFRSSFLRPHLSPGVFASYLTVFPLGCLPNLQDSEPSRVWILFHEIGIAMVSRVCDGFV